MKLTIHLNVLHYRSERKVETKLLPSDVFSCHRARLSHGRDGFSTVKTLGILKSFAWQDVEVPAHFRG